jgi:hypothetical protein
MASSLLSIKPHEVSKDLRGYSLMLYGTPKSGKTYTATRFPKHLLLAFEKGYSAIPGAMVQPINSWGEFKSVLIDLRDDEVKEAYETIIIDTADIAYDYCCDYIANQNEKATIADMDYGKGYALAGKEFDKSIRKILQLGYGLILISHAQESTDKDVDGADMKRLMPTLDKRGRLICERTCDIVGLIKPGRAADGTVKSYMYMRETPEYQAGSRFKYMTDKIELSYDNLVSAISDAIEKEEKATGGKYITAARANVYADDKSDDMVTEDDLNAVKAEFQKVVGDLLQKNQANRAKIPAVIDKYLPGKKVSDAKVGDIDAIRLIIKDLGTL